MRFPPILLLLFYLLVSSASSSQPTSRRVVVQSSRVYKYPLEGCYSALLLAVACRYHMDDDGDTEHSKPTSGCILMMVFWGLQLDHLSLTRSLDLWVFSADKKSVKN